MRPARARSSPHTRSLRRAPAAAWALAVIGGLLACGCRAGRGADEDAEALPASVAAVREAAAPRALTPHTRETAEAAGERFVADWFSFALADVTLSLFDLHGTRDLQAALGGRGALFATNAGFFDTRDAPLGLSVSGGERRSRFSRGLSGGVLEITGGQAAVLETETYDPSRAPEFAVQCRPRLVVAGKANVRRDDGKRAERTAVCVRDGGRTVAFVLAKDDERGPSLFALGRYLEAKGCGDALSLDGGPSTGAAFLGPHGREELALRGPIQQAIVVAAREAAQ